jgi:hypothetical protein
MELIIGEAGSARLAVEQEKEVDAFHFGFHWAARSREGVMFRGRGEIKGYKSNRSRGARIDVVKGTP